jgi:hypothetical protein
MRLDHITPSKNVIDIQISFVPDMDAMYGPAVEALPLMDGYGPEQVLVVGITLCALVAVELIIVGCRIWKRMKS